jgi:hypothetical protein
VLQSCGRDGPKVYPHQVGGLFDFLSGQGQLSSVRCCFTGWSLSFDRVSFTPFALIGVEVMWIWGSVPYHRRRSSCHMAGEGAAFSMFVATFLFGHR